MSKNKTPKADPNVYPPGWGRSRTEAVIKHYESQGDDAAIAEAEAAWTNKNITLMRVPTPLVAKVDGLIRKYESSRVAKPASESRKSRPKPAA